MKALKTIVATAVIVFALTTVAMAGVQRLNGGGGEAGAAQAAQTNGSVTISARQFATLLHAAIHQRTKAASQTGAPDRPHAQTYKHAEAHAHNASRNTPAAQTTQSTRTTHHAETHHAETHYGTHDGTQSGSHDGDSHDGEAHDGGCD